MGLDARVVLGHARPAGEPCRAIVAGASVNLAESVAHWIFLALVVLNSMAAIDWIQNEFPDFAGIMRQ